MRTFSQTQPKQDLDPDRLPIKEGLRVIVQKIVISDKTKYNKIAHIDGLRLPEKTPGKWYTTSDVLTSQFEDVLKYSQTTPDGNLSPEDEYSMIILKKGKNGYLTQADFPT